MTDIVKNLKAGMASLGQADRARGFRRGQETINLTEIWKRYEITVSDMPDDKEYGM